MAVTNFRDALKLNKLPVQGLVPESASSAPSSPVDGQLWWDTANTALKVSVSGTWKNPLARADHTGTQLANTISDLATTVRAYRLDQFAAPTAAMVFGGQRLTGVADPSSATDAATKSYVDNARAGLSVKDPVRVVAQVNVNLASLPSALDGVTMTAGDRFLVPSQTTATQNGLYVYSSGGSAATRSADADQVGEVFDGSMVAVAEGTDAGAQYIQTATPSGAPGSWTQTWTKYSTGGQTYVAGSGLSLTGSTFAVVADPAGPLTVSGSGVNIATLPLAKGGTGATTAPAARTALGATGKYAADVGALTGGAPLSIAHNLGTTDILEPSLREVSSGELVGAKFVVVDANTVSVTVASSYAAAVFRITVVG